MVLLPCFRFPTLVGRHLHHALDGFFVHWIMEALVEILNVFFFGEHVADDRLAL